MELYKYTGSVAALTVRFGKAETITLYDSYDDSVALLRLPRFHQHDQAGLDGAR